MTAPILRRKRRTPSLKETDGLTLIEILIALAVAGIVVTLALGLTLSSRQLLQIDQVRTGVNQSLRGSLEIVGSDVRLAGEGYVILPNGFSEIPVPAIEVFDNELIIRRQPADAPPVLPLCRDLSAGSSTNEVRIGRRDQNWDADCYVAPPDEHPNLGKWREFRGGEPTRVLIFQNDGSARSEFFTSEVRSSSGLQLHREPGPWIHSYGRGASIMILEQNHYRLNSETQELELIVNGEVDNPMPISGDINSFEVRAIMSDGSVRTTLSGNEWTDVQTIELTINGNIQAQRGTVERTLTSKFFPRNILSRSDN